VDGRRNKGAPPRGSDFRGRKASARAQGSTRAAHAPLRVFAGSTKQGGFVSRDSWAGFSFHSVSRATSGAAEGALDDSHGR